MNVQKRIKTLQVIEKIKKNEVHAAHVGLRDSSKLLPVDDTPEKGSKYEERSN